MGVNLYYRILPVRKHYFHVSGRSSFIEAMKRAFGEPPWVIASAQTDVITGMMACTTGEDPNPFQTIADLVERHPEGIEIWPEW